MKRIRQLVTAALLAATAGAAVGREGSAGPAGSAEREVRPVPAVPARFEFVAPHMGTLFKITLFAPDAGTAERAARAAFARIAELNRILSDYDPASEAMRLCRVPPGSAVPVSRDLWNMLRASQDLSVRSDGAFEATAGSVVALWREARRTRQLPAEAERRAALRAAGSVHLRLDETARTATLLTPGLRLDFGGIAKGYAADAALAVLRAEGLPQAMVAASGDLALGDAPPGQPGWKVALEPFGRGTRAPVMIVAANVGLSTSGDAEQFVEIDGVRYSHVVDPATGIGLTTSLAVTVVARTGTEADALATAGSVLAVRGDVPRITACLGNAARALVLRRGRDGEISSLSYGTNPHGVRTGW